MTTHHYTEDYQNLKRCTWKHGDPNGSKTKTTRKELNPSEFQPSNSNKMMSFLLNKFLCGYDHAKIAKYSLGNVKFFQLKLQVKKKGFVSYSIMHIWKQNQRNATGQNH